MPESENKSIRRYIFYLSIWLLAFGIGSFVVFIIFVNGKSDLPVSDEVKASQIGVIESFLENSKTKQAGFVEIAFKNLPCEDENLKPFWNELIDKTVSINTDYLERIKNCSDLIEADYLVGSNGDGQVDLNNDGRKEIFIKTVSSNFCGNNCQTFWAFQKDNQQGYRKLFEAKGYMAVVENKKANGYKDILFEVYARDVEFDINLYKFDGTKYIPKKCWSESKLEKNKNGDLAEAKEFTTEYYECIETEFVKLN